MMLKEGVLYARYIIAFFLSVFFFFACRLPTLDCESAGRLLGATGDLFINGASKVVVLAHWNTCGQASHKIILQDSRPISVSPNSLPSGRLRKNVAGGMVRINQQQPCSLACFSTAVLH